MRTAFEVVSGIAVGILLFGAMLCMIGCAVSPCVHAIGACGKTAIFYDDCQHRVIVGSMSGAFVDEPKPEKPVFDPTTPEPGRWRPVQLAPRLQQECKA